MRRSAALAFVLVLLTVTPIVGSLVEFLGAESWSPRPVELASRAEVEGDPASDEEVAASTDAGGREARIVLGRTAAPIVDRAPAGERVREASPTGPVEAELRLAAGPVALDDAGNLSPAFPLDARLGVDADDDVDRAWLRLDGDRWTRLPAVGHDGERRIHMARLASHTLPAGETTQVDVVFERQLGPEATQILQGPGWDVHADARGPPPPALAVENGTVHLDSSTPGLQAQTRTPGGDWRPAPIVNRSVQLSGPGPVEVRARAIDEVGNPGPWGPPQRVANLTSGGASPRPSFELLAPEPGERIEGEFAIAWRPAEASPRVEVEARSSQHEDRQVGEAVEPPIVWRTGFVPDGDWTLHVRAHTDDGWTSRLIPVTVDNLAEPNLTAAEPEDASTRPPGLVQRTRSPISAALASGVAALALTGLVGRAWKRRPK